MGLPGGEPGSNGLRLDHDGNQLWDVVYDDLPEDTLHGVVELANGSVGTQLLVFMLAVVAAPIVEEIAFRGVLWAMLARRMDWVHATWITAVLFGLWHILGSLDLHERNPGLAMHGKPRIAQRRASASQP